MSIINLTDATKAFEEIKLSPQKNFKIKSNYTTDHYNLFDETIIDTSAISATNSDTGFTFYGLTPLYSFKTNVLKEIGSGGNTQSKVNNNFLNIDNENIFSYPFSDLSKIRPEDNNQLEIDSNYFGIKRLQQELKPFSKTLNKKKIVRNLYESYHSLTKAKYSQKFNYGFYNYNCFNFFNILPGNKINNQFKDNFKNKSHKKALIYSNANLSSANLSNQSQIKLGADEDLTINFWINPKRTAMINKRYNPGCILHLPNIISIYLIPDNSKLNFNNQAIEFKILCLLGEFSNILPDNNNINEEFDHFLISDTNLTLNTWYNISIIKNKSDIKVYVNDTFTGWRNDDNNTDLDNLKFENEIPSILTIGNRLNSENIEFWTNDKEKLKNYFFNKNNFKQQHLNENEINLDYQTQLTENEINWNVNIYNQVDANFNYALASQALNAELYGLMIFNKEINFDTLKRYAYGNESIIKNIYLSFYLPCIYIADLIKRKGYITLGTRDDIAYRSAVNPYFAHKIYGHELSIESFSLDIVNLRKPYILGMNGEEYPDAFSTQLGNFTQNGERFAIADEINLVIDFFVRHRTPTQLLNKVITSNIGLLDNNFLGMQFNNIVYRNNFILPCDNGKTQFDLTEIFNETKIKNIIGDSIKTFYHHQNPHYVKLENLYQSNKEYSATTPQDFFENPVIYDRIFGNTERFVSLPPLSVRIPGRRQYVPELLFNENSELYIQKIIYETAREATSKAKVQDFFQNLKAFSNNKHLLSNSLFKNIDNNYNASLSNPENINWSSKSIDNETVFYSAYFNSHYSIEGDLAETHSVLFDISNVLYSAQLRKKFIEIKDIDLAGSGGALNITIKDNGLGQMYRADCNGVHATWAHLGHAFYSDGLVNVLHPGLSNFGENNFSFDLKGEHSLHVMQIDIPIERGDFNVSQNKSYIKGLKPSNNLSDLEETDFVYVTGVNLHDENLNIVAKAKFAQPIVKRLNDRYNIRLKMDF